MLLSLLFFVLSNKNVYEDFVFDSAFPALQFVTTHKSLAFPKNKIKLKKKK